MNKKRIFSLPAIILCMVLLIAIAMIGYEFVRENRFAPLIKAYSHAYDLDPLLIKAVIKKESNFNPQAKGKKGEIGLMQITPTVGREFAQEKDLESFKVADLWEPALNIHVGCWYLAKGMARYESFTRSVPFALSFYNAGGSNTDRWLDMTSSRGNAREFMRTITYPGTRDYVRSILRRWRLYKIFSL